MLRFGLAVAAESGRRSANGMSEAVRRSGAANDRRKRGAIALSNVRPRRARVARL